MRNILLGFVLCVTCLAGPLAGVEIVVPPSAAHPQDWLRPQLTSNPNPNYQAKSAATLAEFVAPEVVSKIVVDQYAGDPDEVRRDLSAMPTAAYEYFAPSMRLCRYPKASGTGTSSYGARLDWTSTSSVHFESGRSGKLAVATVVVSRVIVPPPGTSARPTDFGLSESADCLGLDKVPPDSLFVSYTDPDGHTWAFAVLRKKAK